MSTAARRYLDVVGTLTHRELLGRRRGTFLGLGGALIVPAAFLLVYGFVFSTIVPIKLRPEATRSDYAFFLFAGLVAWNIVAETLGRAPSLFSANSALLRKAGFPSSALPLAAAATAWCHAQLWLLVFVAARLLSGEAPQPAVLAAPLLLVPVALFSAGSALVLATLASFIRDLEELMPPILALLLFLSPILYPAERLAAASPWLVAGNPLTPMLVSLRDVMLRGQAPDPANLALSCAWAAAAALLGFGLYARARAALTDLAG